MPGCHPSNSLRWLLWALAILLNRAETDKTSAQTALSKSEEQFEQNYRSMFEEALIGMFQTTPDGKFLSVNPAMAEILVTTLRAK